MVCQLLSPPLSLLSSNFKELRITNMPWPTLQYHSIFEWRNGRESGDLRGKNGHPTESQTGDPQNKG
jgi:hypothetical protein